MEIKIITNNICNNDSMKTLYCVFLAISLTCPRIGYAITAEDCEKEGEIIFTRECINQMLNKQEDESRLINQVNAKIVEKNKDNAVKKKSSDPEKQETLRQVTSQPISINDKKGLAMVQKTEPKPPATQKEEKSESVNTKILDPSRDQTLKQCDTRSFFKALESKQQKILAQCKLTSELINQIDWRAERRGRTPLHWAVFTKNYDLLTRLLAEGAKPNTPSQSDLGATPLHLAVMLGDITSTQELLKKAVNIDAQNILKETPLHLAVKFQSKELIQLLLENGADIEARDRTGKTPLLTASLISNVSIIKYLLEKGARVDVQTKQGNSPLHYSVLISPKTTKKILLSGGSMMHKNSAGETPTEKLRANYLPQHMSTLRLLESLDKDNSERNIIKAPLLISLEREDVKEFKKLLEEGESPSGLTIGDLNNKPKFKAVLQQADWL